MTYDVCVTEAYVPATEKDNSRKRDCGCVSRCHAIRAFAAPAGNDVCRPPMHSLIKQFYEPESSSSLQESVTASTAARTKHCSLSAGLHTASGPRRPQAVLRQ